MPISTTDERLTAGGDEIVVRVASERSEGAILALEVAMAPGGGAPMLHRHDPFELYRVEEGELTFYVEDDDGVVRRTRGARGTVVAIPAGREHTVRNESGAPARAFVVFSPGAAFERFVRAMAGATDPNAIPAIAAEHGIEVTRPVAAVDG